MFFFQRSLSALRPNLRSMMPRTASYMFRDNSSWIAEPLMTYKMNAGKFNFEGVLGSTIQQETNNVLESEWFWL